MAKHTIDRLFPISVNGSVPINPSKVAERKKIMDHLRRQANKGDQRRGDLHKLLKSKDAEIEFHAICVSRGKRIDIERVGASFLMDTDDATTLVRSGAVTKETAPLSDLAIEIEAARKSLERTNYDPKALIFPLIETGIASSDRAIEAIRKRAIKRGYRVNDLPAPLYEELEHLVNDHFEITNSWFYNLHSVYVPPENLVALASEIKKIETWLRNLDEEKANDPNFGAKLAASIDKFATDLRKHGVYGYFESIVSAFYKRLESITIGTDGVSATFSKEENDNDCDEKSRAG